MPKKKDKKSVDKQDEKRQAPRKGALEPPRDKTVPDDREKDLYLIQIQYLNEQLEGYQVKCDQLEREKNDFSSQCILLKKEKKDIVEYLKHSLLEKEEEVDELTERMESQQHAADRDRDNLQQQNSQLRKELQDKIRELTAENKTLVSRLDSLDEFEKQREQLKSNMESLEKQLTSQEEDHKDDIHSLEMKALMEKKRLEEEMEKHVAAMAADVQHQVEQKVPETTRLVLKENTEFKAQISQLSVHMQVLMVENSALQERKNRLRADVENLDQMVKETCRQNCILKRVVEQLTEKCQQLQAELKERSHELEQIQTEHTGVQAEMKTLRQEQATLTEQCSKNRDEMSQLKDELQEERRKRSRMKGTIEEAAVMLKEALTDSSTEQDPEVDSEVQWKQLMQKLLLVLESPKLNKLTAKSNQLNGQQTSDHTGTRKLPGQKKAGSFDPLHPADRLLTSKNTFTKIK
ncbi:cilia- and flagella-associated protein 157 [Cheilinus undulatus]|uniref:cilia- and flagella-associated protein 157 n=1 Tax=Cheilinus undulatus TaxID=241271 RepID=UPI001BD31391|nr:cilia- and flagella-associated protein 157 [Cheilinus undulatus]